MRCNIWQRMWLKGDLATRHLNTERTPAWQHRILLDSNSAFHLSYHHGGVNLGAKIWQLYKKKIPPPPRDLEKIRCSLEFETHGKTQRKHIQEDSLQCLLTLMISSISERVIAPSPSLSYSLKDHLSLSSGVPCASMLIAVTYSRKSTMPSYSQDKERIVMNGVLNMEVYS